MILAPCDYSSFRTTGSISLRGTLVIRGSGALGSSIRFQRHTTGEVDDGGLGRIINAPGAVGSKTMHRGKVNHSPTPLAAHNGEAIFAKEEKWP